MGRFLFVVPPLGERVRPVAAVARELAARGHEAVWTGHRDVLEGVLPPGATVLPSGGGLGEMLAASAAGSVAGLRSPAGLMVLWDDFLLPLARNMLPGVRAAVAAFGPDVLVVDQHALAGAAVAQVAGLPWVTSVPTSAGLLDPLGDLPQIAQRVRRLARPLLVEAGLDDVSAARFNLRGSPYLVVAFSTEALAGPVEAAPGPCVFVGPCLARRVDETPFEWDRLDGRRPLVLVSREPRRWGPGVGLYAAADRALSSLDVQGVIVRPGEVVREASPGVLVVPRAPWRALMRRAAVVICDGDHTVVCEALAHGVPLVVVPMAGDQPLLADQVERAGCGVRVPGPRIDAARLRRAIETGLTSRDLRLGAERVRDSFAAAGGSVAAVDHLERLLDAPVPAW